MTNFSKYNDDLTKLIRTGEDLLHAMQYQCYPKEFKASVAKLLEADIKELEKRDEAIKTFLEKIPSFQSGYQSWYSESLVVIKLLLPDRFEDFVKQYSKPKARKEISYENYVIEDYLQGLTVTRGYEEVKVVGIDAAIPKLTQQVNILKSVKKRFESSLFEITQLLQANLFDSELDAALELNKNGFFQAAGAMSGVVLEKHLSQVCNAHRISISKNRPTLSDFNQALKDNAVIDLPTWRYIQLLTDLRNLCSHDRASEISEEKIKDLIDGTAKIIKTVF